MDASLDACCEDTECYIPLGQCWVYLLVCWLEYRFLCTPVCIARVGVMRALWLLRWGLLVVGGFPVFVC